MCTTSTSSTIRCSWVLRRLRSLAGLTAVALLRPPGAPANHAQAAAARARIEAYRARDVLSVEFPSVSLE